MFVHVPICGKDELASLIPCVPGRVAAVRQEGFVAVEVGSAKSAAVPDANNLDKATKDGRHSVIET